MACAFSVAEVLPRCASHRACNGLTPRVDRPRCAPSPTAAWPRLERLVLRLGTGDPALDRGGAFERHQRLDPAFGAGARRCDGGPGIDRVGQLAYGAQPRHQPRTGLPSARVEWVSHPRRLFGLGPARICWIVAGAPELDVAVVSLDGRCILDRSKLGSQRARGSGEVGSMVQTSIN